MTNQKRRVDEALEWLKRRGSGRTRTDMLERYGITAQKAFGVPVGAIKQLAKRLGRDHDLAGALWQSGWYEARMLAVFVDDPARVTPAQMDRWARDFDNWAICDTACFSLFDRSPGAWRRVGPWSRRREEFVKRAAFALLASLALHDKTAKDERFVRCLPLVVRAAGDDRHLVTKGVSWALRSVGRRNAALNAAAVELAGRLAQVQGGPARAIGKEALRELTGPVVRRQLARRKRTNA